MKATDAKDLSGSELPDAGEVYSNAFPGDVTARTQMSLAAIEITNRRYQGDIFWGGPKGTRYACLVGALPIQQAHLYPDQGSTYFVGQFKLPKGCSLTIRGQYPHARYFSFTVAQQSSTGQLYGGDNIIDIDINPDAGSKNPFSPEQDRNTRGNRNYTVHVVQGGKPPDPPVNTIYTGASQGSHQAIPVHLALRVYIPDVGYDGTGAAELEPENAYGLPEITLNLADGRQVTGPEMAEILRVTKAGEAGGYPLDEWLSLVAASRDPRNAPCKRRPAFEVFWNDQYNVTGAFISDPEKRVRLYPASSKGGFANNPSTVYLMESFSLAFGEVVVIRGKMPTFPRTRHRQKVLEQNTQVRYWSCSSGGSAPSGVGWTSVFDEEVPLDADGCFTLVMSWPEDRPKNATRKNGVIWLDFGGGEGHYVGARSWINVVYLRYQVINPDWAESPANIPPPTESHPLNQAESVMGPYYPTAEYTTKELFERNWSGEE
ncbi:MAG: hypothetical protein JNN30_11455 [Rhodanobacteraceae bacterium]|nr:hypothetical protein [Rhodanobacteraceae bacterium]